MPTVSRHRDFPDILIVDGLDPAGDYRPGLREALYAAGAASPVRRGTHDIWMCFPFPAQSGDVAPSFGHADPADFGRPLRGIADMRRIPPGTGRAAIEGDLFTALHEWSHAWLVPGDMRVRIGGVEQVPIGSEFKDLLDRERPLVRPAVLGREGSHWSCYVNFYSCHDSVLWARETTELPGIRKWTQRPQTPATVRPPNLPPVQTWALLSDLDLAIMNAKHVSRCFPTTGGEFYWMEPKLSIGSPIQYDVGLFVAFSRSDFITFGFHDDHGTLRADRSGTGQISGTVAIGAGYQPLRQELEAMMLRVVRRGSRYLCQACRGNTVLNVFGGRGPGMFDDLENAPDTGDFSRWRTVASFTAGGATPRAIGVITKTRNAIIAEGQYFVFETRQGTVNEAHSFNVAPTRGMLDLARLPGDRLVCEVPAEGALIRPGNLSRIMGVPYDRAYDVDQAPKMMMRAPAGDFAFGASMKVRRSLVAPHSGGAAAGITMWGVERSANVADIVHPERLRRRWHVLRGGIPHFYPTAFVVVTDRAGRVPRADLVTLDVFRRYFDAGVQAVTQGLCVSESRL